MNSIQTVSDSKLNLVKFFKEIKLKKQYIKQLKNKATLLNLLKEKNYKKLNSKLFFYDNLKQSYKEDFLVTYIIDITFSKTNTFLHIMDFSGHLKFFCSAGTFQYKGKGKRFRYPVFKEIYKVLFLKLNFLKDQPLAVHLKNVGFAKFWILKLLKRKFFIKVVRSFNRYPYNGCRKKKMRRKKFKKKKKKWPSGLRRQTVNLLSFLITGSNPVFFTIFKKNLIFSKYNVAVACLLWEQEVMCSNHIISKTYNKILNVLR